MSTEAINFIPAATSLAELVPAEAGAMNQATGGNFATWLQGELSAIDQKMAAADSALTGLATGETGNIHQVMLALEETRLAFSLMVEVRNKALEAYQDIMRMQV